MDRFGLARFGLAAVPGELPEGALAPVLLPGEQHVLRAHHAHNLHSTTQLKGQLPEIITSIP